MGVGDDLDIAELISLIRKKSSRMVLNFKIEACVLEYYGYSYFKDK